MATNPFKKKEDSEEVLQLTADQIVPGTSQYFGFKEFREEFHKDDGKPLMIIEQHTQGKKLEIAKGVYLYNPKTGIKVYAEEAQYTAGAEGPIVKNVVVHGLSEEYMERMQEGFTGFGKSK